MNTTAPNGATTRAGAHPGIVVGAIALVVFGAAGAASYLGLLPGQSSKLPAIPMSAASPAQQAGTVPDAVVAPKPAADTPAPNEYSMAVPADNTATDNAQKTAQPAAVPVPAPAQQAAAPPPASPAPPQSSPASIPRAPIQATPAPAKPAPSRAQVAPPKPAPATPVQARAPAEPASPPARPAPATPSYAASAPAFAPPVAVAPPREMAAPETAPPSPVAAVCRDCGTVSSITPIERKGESSGAGAVLGGIVGGVLGHQVGSGRGRDVATVAGALGGALLGNEVEKNQGAVTAWDIRVRLEDGTSKVLRVQSEPSWRVGDKVRIENGQLVSARQP